MKFDSFLRLFLRILEYTPDPQPTVYVSEFLSFEGLGKPGVCETGGPVGVPLDCFFDLKIQIQEIIFMGI